MDRSKLMVAGILSFLFLISIKSSFAANDLSFQNYRGINVTFYPQHSLESEAADLDEIAGWGANFLRLVLRTDPGAPSYCHSYNADGSFNEDTFKKLDAFLDMAAKRKIHVILDMHTFPGQSDNRIWEDYAYWDKFTDLWSFIAARYKDNQTVLGFEIINEPDLVDKEGQGSDPKQILKGTWVFPSQWLNTPKDYFSLVERIGQAINKVAPDKIVVIPAVGEGGQPINFKYMRPVNVQNVMYTFHMYIPHKFSDMKQVGSAAYNRDKDYPKMLKAMEYPKNFAQAYNAKMYVGEFGLTYYTEGMGARQWMEDVINYFEENGLSWSYWSYSNKERDPRVIVNPDGTFENHEDTERLSVLKEYWKKNQ